MKTRLLSIPALMLCSALVAGCAGDQMSSIFGGGETASIAPPQPKVDPACVSLSAKIEELRKEGITEKVQQASAGKGATVSVKRASLAKMAELDKANADFQAKCSTITPKQQTAQAVPAASAAAAAPSAAVKPAASAKPAPAQQ